MAIAGAHEFTTVSSETVYAGAIIALRVDEVLMPGQVSARREVVEHFGAVAVVALESIDGVDHVVLIHQYRHPLGRRLWELPAGLLDDQGELPVAAARRELIEEVGLDAHEWSVLADVAVSPGCTDEVVRVYLATQLQAVSRPVPEYEEADLIIERMPLVQAVHKIFSGEIVNATAISGLLAAQAYLQKMVPELRSVQSLWLDRPTAFAARR
ncbi:MAG: NUDIX domain-containing protein [Mycobacteriaceae bacterium]